MQISLLHAYIRINVIVFFATYSRSPLLSRAVSQGKQYIWSKKSLATHTHDDLENWHPFQRKQSSWKEVRTCFDRGQLKRVELRSVSHSTFDNCSMLIWFRWLHMKRKSRQDTRVINCMGRCPLLSRAYGYDRTTMQQHCICWGLRGPKLRLLRTFSLKFQLLRDSLKTKSAYALQCCWCSFH